MRPRSISDRPGAVSSSRFRVHETAHSFFPSALSDGFGKSCPSPGDLLPEAAVVRARTQHSHLLRQTLLPFVQLLCSRVSSSHTSVGLLTQFLGLSHYFDT